METLAQNARLDVHEKQIQQLQSDVSEIKTTLKELEVDRDESRKFRKEVLNWMTQREQTTVVESSSSGGNFGEVLTYSRTDSVSGRDFGPKSASDGVMSGGLPSLVAQLEALVSRSEKRLRGYGHLMSTYQTDSRSSGSDSKLPRFATPVVSVMSRSDKIPVDQGSLVGPLFRSPSSLPDSSPSLLAQLRAKIFRSEENSLGHRRVMSLGVMSDDLQRKLGSVTVLGQGEKQVIIVGRDSPDLGLFCEKVLPARFGLNMAASLYPNSSLTSLIDSYVNHIVAPHVTTILNHLLHHNQLMLPQLNALLPSSTNKDSDSEQVTINYGASVPKYAAPVRVRLKIHIQIFVFDPGPNSIKTPYFSQIICICHRVYTVLLEFGLSVLGYKLVFTQMVRLCDQPMVILFRDKRDNLTTSWNSQFWTTHTIRDLSFGTFASVGTSFPTTLQDFLWWYKTASPVIELMVGSYHLWVVHGQGRPPENALGVASAWLSSQLSVPSLEDKTVLKAGVMIGIMM